MAFTFENEFVTDFESLTKQQPSEVVICALEKMEAVYFSRKSLIDLYKQVPVFVEVGQRIMENLLIQKDHYATLFTRLSPTERYAHLLHHFPHIIQRVPLYYLASYLGIARETLSRIRQKK